MKAGLVVALLLGMAALIGAAHAALPDEVLEHDYRNCVGGDKDPARIAYCGCVRDGMKNWDESTYAAIATQEAANAVVAGAIPAPIEELAKSCIAKVLR